MIKNIAAALAEQIEYLWLEYKFKNLMKKMTVEQIINLHLSKGFTRYDSSDGKTTVLRKGKAEMRINITD